MKEGDKRFINDFLAGQRDCRNGIPHEDKSEAYTRGYGAEYAAQEVIAWHYEYQNQRGNK